MLNFSKSSSASDLQNRTDVQHKVLCDWLRQLHSQNIQLARKLTLIYNLLQETESQFSSPSGEPVPDDDSIDSRSV